MAGPGNYVSDGHVWKPAIEPLRQGPADTKRSSVLGPVIVGNDGKPILVPNQAAVESIHKYVGADATEAPVVEFPTMDTEKEKSDIAELKKRIEELTNQMSAQQEKKK